jgi:hypothetical protein
MIRKFGRIEIVIAAMHFVRDGHGERRPAAFTVHEKLFLRCEFGYTALIILKLTACRKFPI